MIVAAADLARRGQSRGLKLNFPEAVALISYELIEGARDGRTVAELMSYGTTLLGRRRAQAGRGFHVQPGPRAGQRRITVRFPSSRIRPSQCQRTAVLKAAHSASRPTATRSSAV